MIEQREAVHRITNRCPKCRGQTFDIITVVQVETCRSFENGIQTFGPVDVSMHTDKASIGECRCGHKWRLRNPHLDYVDQD